MEGQPRLDSWKEISFYLGRSTSTCHRWEEDLGLPVHRLDGTPKARVFAFPEELDRWMREKLHVAEALAKEDSLTRHRKRNRALVSAGALVVFAGLAFAAWRVLIPPPPVPFNNPWLVVLPFDNPAGDGSLEPWTTAFPDLLTTDLRQSRYINVLALTEVDMALQGLKLSQPGKYTLEDIVKIIEELDVDYAATGSLVRAGEGIIINALVYDGKARQRLSEIQAGSGERSFLAMADRLSRELKVAAKLTPRAISHDIDRPVANVSTASPEAFKLYSRGYRLANRGENEEGFRFLQKAVDIDPGFGLAYKALFGTAKRAQRKDDQAEYAERVIHFSHRVSEREYLLLEAEYYDFVQHDLVKSLAANGRLWALFPDYPEAPGGLLFLPRLYLLTEEYDKMIAAYDRMGARRRRQSGDPSSLVACFLAMGQLDKAEKYIADFQTLNPGRRELISSLRGDLLVAQRRFADALALEAGGPGQDARATRPADPAGLGYILWASDDLAGAEKAYGTVSAPGDLGEEDIRLPNLAVVALSKGEIVRLIELAKRGLEIAESRKNAASGMRWRYILALALRIAGRLPDALKASEEVCRAYEQRGEPDLVARQLRALITLEMDRADEFEAQVREIRKLIEGGSKPKLMRSYYHLLGQRELRKGNAEAARGYFWKALDLLPGIRQGLGDGDPVRHYYSMAEAISLDGASREAIPYYEKVVSTTSGRSWSGDLYAKSYYKMAKAYQRLIEDNASPSGVGDFRAKALANYRKFLELWKDADPIFPEIEDARRSLAGLEAGRTNLP